MRKKCVNLVKSRVDIYVNELKITKGGLKYEKVGLKVAEK